MSARFTRRQRAARTIRRVIGSGPAVPAHQTIRRACARRAFVRRSMEPVRTPDQARALPRVRAPTVAFATNRSAAQPSPPTVLRSSARSPRREPVIHARGSRGKARVRTAPRSAVCASATTANGSRTPHSAQLPHTCEGDEFRPVTKGTQVAFLSCMSSSLIPLLAAGGGVVILAVLSLVRPKQAPQRAPRAALRPSHVRR
jgi:hypothetical protein